MCFEPKTWCWTRTFSSQWCSKELHELFYVLGWQRKDVLGLITTTSDSFIHNNSVFQLLLRFLLVKDYSNCTFFLQQPCYKLCSLCVVFLNGSFSDFFMLCFAASISETPTKQLQKELKVHIWMLRLFRSMGSLLYYTYLTLQTNNIF